MPDGKMQQCLRFPSRSCLEVLQRDSIDGQVERGRIKCNSALVKLAVTEMLIGTGFDESVKTEYQTSGSEIHP